MRVLGGFVQEQILHHDALHGRERSGHMLCVGIGLHDVFALAVQALERSCERGLEHVGDAQARLGLQGHAPVPLELAAHGVVGDVAVARQLVRERPHVARPLHVVLSAQWVHAHAFAADVAGGHCQVGDRHDGGRALAVFRHAQAVVDGAVAARGVQPRRAAHGLRGHACDFFHRFRRVLRQGYEVAPFLEGLGFAACGDEGLVDQALGGDHVRQRGQQRGIGARTDLQVEVGLDVRRAYELDAARVDHDQAGALAQAALQARGEHRVAAAGVGAHDDHHVGMHDRVERLRAGGFAQGLLQAIAGGRMADPRAGVDVVRAERRAHQLLHQPGFFVGAARRGDAADRVAAMFFLDAAEFGGRVADGLVPGHFFPGIGDVLADHGLQHALFVRGVAPGEAALDAGMAAVGLAVFPGHHAHHFLSLHLGLEAAAHAAIGAGGDDRVLGLAHHDDGLFLQGRGGTGLHAGAAGHAFAVQERLVLPWRYARVEALAGDRQRERALRFLAGAHAPVADDALRRVVAEVRVGLVFFALQVVGAAVAVAYVAQAHHARHVLQFAIAVGRTGQAVQRMVGDVELHHAAPQIMQLRRLGVDDHAVFSRRRARGRVAPAALDLHQAKPARAEGFQAVRRAQLGDIDAGLRGRAHQRRAGRYGDGLAVDGKGDGFDGLARRRAHVAIALDDGF
ncbi:hypothetical protein FQZ97_599210 [compost metagenome]